MTDRTEGEPADFRDTLCERCVLGSLLVHPDLFGSINGDFSPALFAVDAHRLVAGAIVALNQAGSSADMLAVKAHLQDGGQLRRVGVPALLRLPDDVLLTDGASLRRNVVRLRELATARQGLYHLDDARRLLRRHPGQAVAILSSTRDRLLDLTRDAGQGDDETPVGEPLATFLAQAQDQGRVPWLVDQLLPGAGIAMLHGQPRDRKTLAALELALAMSTGTPAFGLPVLAVQRPLRVWYISDEDPRVEVAARFTALLAGRGLTMPSENPLVSIGKGISLDDLGWQARLTRFAQTNHVEMTILDPVRRLTACADAGPDKLLPFASFLNQYQRNTGSGVLLVHHDVKPLVGKLDDRAHPQRASGGGLFSIVAAPIHVEGIDDQRSLLTPAGFKFSVSPPPILIRVESDDPVCPTWLRLVAEVSAAHSAADLAVQQQAFEFVRTHPDLSTNKVAEGLRKDKRAVTKALEELARLGRVASRPGPRRASLWFVPDNQ